MLPLEFVAFLFVVLTLYYLVPRKWQSTVLLCANIFYCLTVSIACLLSVISVSLVTFLSASHIERKKCRRTLVLGLVAVLFSFVLLRVLALFGDALTVFGGSMTLIGGEGGIGLAFYSFSSAGYLIDVYRGKIEREKSFLRLFLFVGFFPCMRLGPISRYKDLAPQFLSPHAPTWENITSGIVRILWGYFKKLVIADTALVALNNMVAEPHKHSGGYAFFLIILYSVIIYADFTGGIDVALGASKMLDIALAENFDRPFSSMSVREYWRRWHITLGAFFSDYFFYPLSISKLMQRLSKRLRKSKFRRIAKRVPIYIALVATWLLTGAWHGMAANYILWGLSNAAVIIIAQELAIARTQRQKKRATAVVGVPARTQEGKGNVVRRLCAVRTFLIIGAIRLFDLWRDPLIAMQSVASIFLDFGGWASLVGGGILALGISVHEWVVIIFGVALMFVSGSRADICEFLIKKPFGAMSCIVFLVLATLIFGSYGIGFEESSFIYSKF